MRVLLSSTGIRVVGMNAFGPDKQRRRERQQQALAEDQPPRDRLSQHLNRFACEPTRSLGVMEASKHRRSIHPCHIPSQLSIALT